MLKGADLDAVRAEARRVEAVGRGALRVQLQHGGNVHADGEAKV
jgi:hypothetical protein